ncbi:uncharacterized protein SPAPADRAFT_58375 [Spathaspora passalidarum NRRL Y-27907]|uniref:Uncharacterized protein SMI1 n=1 Tax=Spathaspora passalidarum (strain NRRL Y-27907 / 11-Y1) TaxID=619300 RepID=G3AG43_SPAPN|nr:uncharacterized protein SPAPADRAFT_58375 [Spathaspora passalidarum NRRL Y-27907]EGW35182.1 hypothetical protein SPAPADRAFT_58375 [Spathaspora passalidarum NRRL Y-27907]
MGLFQEFKAFIHSITTDDHYASYDSRYRNGSSGGAPGLSRGDSGLVNNGSTSRLNEISRLNGSGHSFEQAAAAAKIGYRPGLRSQQDLPLQTFDENGQPPLPSIDSLWDRIERWMEEEYPELEDSLNDGVTTTDLNEFENDLGCGNLPEDFRQFYKRHDGQLRGGRPTGLFMGLALLDLEGIIEENAIWLKVAERLERQQYMVQHQQKEGTSSTASSRGSSVNNSFIGNQRSIPPNSIQPFYYQKGWITLMKDHIGNQIALDLAPGPQGKWGQIIIFGRDFDTKLVIANSLTEFIFNFVTDLEQGNYQIDSSVVQEELGYLGRERNDDYMIGDEDEDEGELFFYDRDNKEFGKGARGKLSYIEVFKRRTLKKYGLTENFSTQFTPQVKPTASAAPKSGTSSPLLNQSRNSSASNLKPGSTKPATSSPLVNSGQFSVPKETIIDDKTTAKSTPEIMVDDTDKTPEPEIEESKPEEVVKSKEESKEDLKEELKEEDQDVNNLV